MTAPGQGIDDLDELRAERLAALNLMEDAILARRQSDAAIAALRESEAQLQLAVDVAQFAVWVWDVKTDSLNVDERTREMWNLGFDEKPSLEQLKQRIDPRDRESANELLQRALNGQENGRFQSELRLGTLENTERWLLVNGQVFFDDKDPAHPPSRVIGTARDITERKKAEEALRQSEERYRALAETLQEIDRRKNHFLAILGHELRNPLAAIRNGVDLLRSAKSSPESRTAALPIVSQQVSHMEGLIDDLLDLTRIVEDKVKVCQQPMVLQEALRRALEMLRPQIEAGNYNIYIDDELEPAELLGDMMRLTQVFVNILGNAIKYSGDSRRIEISLKQERGEAAVRIRDFGQGISPNLMPRIFEPFVQAHPGDTLQAGLGLGLAVVRKLVNLHGGAIHATSDGEGKGSEFVLRLPLQEIHHETPVG
jgi:PAS domain S-box-containing protein